MKSGVGNLKSETELSVSKPFEVAKKITPGDKTTEVEALKKALDEANLKIKALDTMIDIAEQQLKIDIKKYKI